MNNQTTPPPETSNVASNTQGSPNNDASPPRVESGLPVAVATHIGNLEDNCIRASDTTERTSHDQTTGSTSHGGSSSSSVNAGKKNPDFSILGWVQTHKTIAFSLAALLLVGVVVAIAVPVSKSSASSSAASSPMGDVDGNDQSSVKGENGDMPPPGGAGGDGRPPPPGMRPPPPSYIFEPPSLELATTFPSCFSVNSSSSCYWQPIGYDLYGPEPGDFYGAAVCLGKTHEGSKFSISAPYHANAAGRIELYNVITEEDESITDSPELLPSSVSFEIEGRTIVPKFFGDRMLGTLSDDGHHLMVSSTLANNGMGHVRVFLIYPDGQRYPIANDLNGINNQDEFGRASINRDGTAVAISDAIFDYEDDNGVMVNDAGVVRIFKVDKEEDIWMPIGDSILGSTEGERFGRVLSLSGDGMRVAIGSTEYDKGGVNDEDFGIVRVYQFNEDSVWEMIGQEIMGEVEKDRVGKEIKLSADGNVLAVAMNAAWVDDDGEQGSGLVRIFEYDEEENQWVPIGDIVSGTESHLDFGSHIDLSDDGKRIAIGQPRFSPSDSLSEAGRLQVFDLFDGEWHQVGEDILGERNCDVLGTGFDLSPNGERILVGFPNAEGLGDEGPSCARDGVGEPVLGFVRMYEMQV